MDFFILAMLFAVGVNALRFVAQRKRIALLGRYLGNYQIEKLMETLTEGYMRCLGESDAERQSQIWSLLAQSEQTPVRGVGGLALLEGDHAGVDRLPGSREVGLTDPEADHVVHGLDQVEEPPDPRGGDRPGRF